jgi:hypothetical protein
MSRTQAAAAAAGDTGASPAASQSDPATTTPPAPGEKKGSPAPAAGTARMRPPEGVTSCSLAEMNEDGTFDIPLDHIDHMAQFGFVVEQS